jgi:DNA invertase Pin-like site-specific DNA recombinase
MGTTWGYARVSAEDQELGLQITALRTAGVPEANIVQEKASGKAGSDRPFYAALLERLKDGDRLVVWKVDRLGRSTLESLNTARDLDERGVHIVITTLGIDLKTPVGRLVFGMMVQIAEFERELIRERVKAGMADAKKRGVHTGRKHTLRPHQRAEAARLHNEEGKSLGNIAALFGCGRTVVYRAIHGDAASSRAMRHERFVSIASGRSLVGADQRARNKDIGEQVGAAPSLISQFSARHWPPRDKALGYQPGRRKRDAAS